MPTTMSPPARIHRPTAAGALAALLAALGMGVAGPTASADPVVPSTEQVATAAAGASDAADRVALIEAELAAARATVDQAAQEAGRAAETYNKARAQLEQRSSEAAQAAAAAQAAQHTAQVATAALSQHAAEVFQSGGGVGQLDVFFGEGLQSVLDRAGALEAVGEERARVVRDAEAARQLAWASQQAAVEARERQAAAEREAQQSAAAAQARAGQVAAVAMALEQRQDRLVAELAGLRRTSVQLESDREAGVAALEAARHEAENRRSVQARAAAQQPPAGAAGSASAAAGAAPGAPGSLAAGGAQAGLTSAASGRVSAVLAFARAHLGDPYVWGAAGPNTWDCSGLTMMAWRQAGVSLGHYTGTQWAQTRPVPLSWAQPGDLVFYGTSPADIYHVGLYVGGGTMIQAPRTGDVVKVSSIYSMGNLLPYVGRP